MRGFARCSASRCKRFAHTGVASSTRCLGVSATPDVRFAVFGLSQVLGVGAKPYWSYMSYKSYLANSTNNAHVGDS